MYDLLKKLGFDETLIEENKKANRDSNKPVSMR